MLLVFSSSARQGSLDFRQNCNSLLPSFLIANSILWAAHGPERQSEPDMLWSVLQLELMSDRMPEKMRERMSEYKSENMSG